MALPCSRFTSLVIVSNNMQKQKSLFLTYVLWLFTGWLGLHHFYLGRDRHAFAWWSTFGGMFLLGWIRDLWRIPDYVDDANETLDFMEQLTKEIKLRKNPKFKIARFAGELMIGYFYGVLLKMALPQEISSYVAAILISGGITFGVHLVGNIGREQGGFKIPYMCTLICYGFLTYWTGEEANYMYCSLAAACTFNYFRQYRRKYSDKTFCKRFLIFTIGVWAVFSLWACFFYFNAEVTTQDGEKVKIRDSVNHFFKSPAWLEFKDTLWELYEQGRKHGWKNLYDELIKALDPKGEANARKVLRVSETATQEEIKTVYKKLVRQWHPDRHKDHKEEAQNKFMEIQEAYDILTSKKKSEHRTDYERTEF